MTQKIEKVLPGFYNGVSTDEPVTLGSTLAVTGASTFTGAATFTAAPVFTAPPTGTYLTATYVGQTTEAATDRQFFVAPVACTVVAISEVHAVAAGGTSTLQVVKDTGTAAPGAGTDLLSAAFDLNATAQTVQVGALSATAADLVLAAGNRLSLDFANTIQSTAGLCVTVILKTS